MKEETRFVQSGEMLMDISGHDIGRHSVSKTTDREACKTWISRHDSSLYMTKV